MIDKRTIYASIIDFTGILLLFSFMYLTFVKVITFTYGREMSVVFPIIAYFITNRYFKDKFWKAFAISAVAMIVLFFAVLFVFVGLPV